MQSELEALREDGFVVLRGALEADAVDAHLRETQAVIETAIARLAPELGLPKGLSSTAALRAACRSPAGLSLVRAAHAFDPLKETARTLVFAPPLHALARRYFGAEPVYWHGGTYIVPRGSLDEAEEPHADYASSAAPDRWGDGLRFWCALEDVNERCGPFYIYRGSHRVTPAVMRRLLTDNGDLAHEMVQQLDAEGRQAWLPTFQKLHELTCRRLGEECVRQGLDRVVFTIGKGDVVVFNPGTTHGTAKVLDGNATRRCLIFDLVSETANIYPPRAYWGDMHDYRRPENRIAFKIERTAAGPRYARPFEVLEDAVNRQVVHS